MFKSHNKDTRTTPDARRRSGVFIVNFEHISHLVLVFLLLTLNMEMPMGMQNHAFTSEDINPSQPIVNFILKLVVWFTKIK